MKRPGLEPGERGGSGLAGRYGFFLGCLIPLRYPGIEAATHKVMEALDQELVPLEGASCCPAPGVTRSFHQETWLTLGARNLVLAERLGVDLMTACNGCYWSLAEIAHTLNEPSMRTAVNRRLSAIDMEYLGTTRVHHLIEVLHRNIGVEAIRARVSRKLDLKVAAHQGCHFRGPPGGSPADRVLTGSMLDDLVEAAGAESVDYPHKEHCCGAGGGVRARKPELALAFTKRKLEGIGRSGARAIVNGCPFCHLQFDRGQRDLGLLDAGGKGLPVVHISQFLALALGTPPDQVGLDLNDTPFDMDRLDIE